MKIRNRLFAALLTLVLLMGMFPGSALAEPAPPKYVQVGLQQNIEGGKLVGRDGLLVWEVLRDYPVGSTVAIGALPEEGWRLKYIAAYWQPDPFRPYQREEIPIREGIGEYLFTVPNGSVSVGAAFEKDYPVHVTVSGEGTASAGVKRAGKDEVVQITATPGQDWKFVQWSSEGSSIQFANEYNAETTFTMPEGETTVHAKFQKKPEAFLLAPPAAIPDLTYNANPQELITPGTAGAGTMEYKFSNEDDSAWRPQIPAAINAGTYHVQYRAGRDEYHSPQTTEPGTVTVNIKQKQIKPEVTLEGWTYEDVSEHIPVITGNEGNANPVITYKEKDAEETAYTDEQPVNAGTYNVRVQIPEEGNFLSGEAVGEFTIAKKEIGVNQMGAFASTITYGQRLKESTLTAEHPDLVEVSWKQPDTVPDAKPGAYGIQHAVIETMKRNYRLPEGVSFSVPLNVLPAVPDMTVQIEKNANGKKAELTAAVKKAGAGSVPGGSVIFYWWNDTENEWQQIQGAVSTESTTDSLIATLSGWDYSGLKSESCLIKASYDGSDKNYSAAEKIIDFSKTAVSYEAKDGSGNTIRSVTWQKGSGKNLDITFKRSEDDHLTYGLFASLEIDGVTVGSANYGAAEGSLKLSVKPEYLETLSVGGHTVKAKFQDGSATVELTVLAAGKSGHGKSNSGKGAAKTGDDSIPESWSSLTLLSAAAMIVLLLYRRKRKTGQ